MIPKALIPVFHVKDVTASVDYYTRVLGFKESFRYGTYAGLILGKCELHVTDPGEPRHVVGSGTAYMICDNVDEYFARLKATGAMLKNEPEDRPYGMRDFAVFDLDQNQLSFGCDLDASDSTDNWNAVSNFA
jgi:uncharacterized glyoxalase superfamily protein PhnB